ncbi:enoyl-CoA hydratase-related protein [Bradyrhizobium sp. 169]|uniref:enoyl-CoA hydratase/isomerase family protein n=1 Tax=Bradyrhizobium sp. 169 TaxID=2782640 RepID=UPI001FF786C3|nr:enoyl-CoA hydratase-related protein [Bradyrhizobium sp. 169]MCK1589544.1 enoyl-CoA hydratase/isomerase family protein [Bradyrhizobium sp. 169]
MEGRFRGFEVTTSASGVATVTFNQPEHLNGVTLAIKRDLAEAVTQLQMDRAVRVVVITGSGRAFCAGDDMADEAAVPTETALADSRRRDFGDALPLTADLPWHITGGIQTYDVLRTMSQCLLVALRALDKPTIAAVNGVAIQTGLSIALACDFRIASTDARLGSATLRFGFMPDEGGHALLVQLIGVAKALDFCLRSRIVSAKEALELGLVNEVVAPDHVLPCAMELAEELAAGPQTAMRLLKRAIYNAADLTLLQAFDDIAIKTAVSDHHPDAREGIAAFREKRRPRFDPQA